VKLLGIRPAREAGDRVELTEKFANQLLAVILCAQLLDSPEDARERSVGIGNGGFRKIFALEREAFTMLQKFFAIKVGW
jgi:hypothetical protein